MTNTASVYMRDNFADTGTGSSIGTLYESPDIIPLRNQVIDANVAFGEEEWLNFFSENVELGQDNYIYLRAHNIGNAAASPKAHLFSSPASSFIHPQDWTPIGTLELGPIQPGERVVRGPIVWDQSKISHLGHYCYICYLSNAGQNFPDPMSLTFATPDEYYQFVADHNNICFHNVNIVDDWNTDSAFRSFIMVGMPEYESGSYKLTLSTDLPKGTPIEVSIDDWTSIVSSSGGDRDVLVNDKIRLTGGQQTEVTFKVDPVAAGDYTLRFSQYAQAVHLGAVSFKLHF
ncbi:MAG: hypothetical protein KDE53_24265 [Caldilineaceae bacterium]|nr:hypothetical protein [Caldilineaceae bacterium]